MSTLEIVCLIGIMVVSFILGRKSKKIRFPIVGAFDFSKSDAPDGKPTLIFDVNPKELPKFSYVVFRIRGGISDLNERRDV